MAETKVKDGVVLYCEYDYESTAEILRRKQTNGCGPGGWKFDLVPDTMYGLSVREACDIHDWMYLFGKTLEDKDRADRSFLNNVIRLIDARTTTNWFGRNILKPLRYRRAKTYYEAVSHFGGAAFWKGKNK
jgi:hypothetical protein